MKIILILGISMLGFVAGLRAQKLSLSQDTLVWQVNQLKDVPHDSVMAYQCQFLTYGAHKVSWVQQNGGYINQFTVKKTSGRWADAAGDGQAEFTIKGDFEGTASLSRNRGSIEITLTLMQDGKNLTPYVFIVSSVTKMKL